LHTFVEQIHQARRHR